MKDHCTRQHDTVHFSQLPWGKWAMQFCFYQISASVNRLGIMVITSIKGSSFPELLNLLCRALDQCTISGQFRPSTINRELLEQWRAILDFPASINYIRAQNRFRLKTWTTLSRSSLKHTRLPAGYSSCRPFTHHLMPSAQKKGQVLSQSGIFNLIGATQFPALRAQIFIQFYWKKWKCCLEGTGFLQCTLEVDRFIGFAD